jgi:hypothetical protein
MYKNFSLTDEERKQIMEQHGAYGYKKPISEQLAPKNSVVGRSATFYATEQEALDAFEAGKPNPSAKGSVIGTITGMDKIENDYVTFKLKVTKGVHDDRGALGKLVGGGGLVVTYMRTNGFFTIQGSEERYYSESVKRLLEKDYFTSDLASNNKMQPASNVAEEIDTDDEEMELSKMYGDEPDYDDDLKSFDNDVDMSSAFEDSDDYEDLYDLSVAKQNLPKDKMDNMGYSRTMDMDYEGAKHHDEIPGSLPTHRKRYNQSDDITYHDYGAYSNPQSDEMGYYLKTYGTPDPDMESETLADRKKNAPLDFPKYTEKDRRDPENLLSWEEKKKRIAQRAEKEAARTAAKERRLAAASLKPGINESKKSIRLTESELVNLIKRMVNEAKG